MSNEQFADLEKCEDVTDPVAPTLAERGQQYGGPQELNWIQTGKDNYMARRAGIESPMLPAGYYSAYMSDNGLVLVKYEPEADDTKVFSGTAATQVVEMVREWTSRRDRYEALGFLPKLGILTYGPQGSGKTTMVRHLSEHVVRDLGGIVLDIDRIELMIMAAQMIREKEPNRLILVSIEDIDEAIRHQGEHDLLQFLDGPDSISNVIFLGSTNYISKLPDRLVKRPGRFDHVIEIPYPEAAVRDHYFQATLPADFYAALSEEVKKRLVAETEGFGMAHLREVCVRMYVMNYELDDILKNVGDLRSDADREAAEKARKVQEAKDRIISGLAKAQVEREEAKNAPAIQPFIPSKAAQAGKSTSALVAGAAVGAISGG